MSESKTSNGGQRVVAYLLIIAVLYLFVCTPLRELLGDAAHRASIAILTMG